VGRHIRAFDWGQTSIGAPGQLPTPLRTTVKMTLTTGHPVIIYWGPNHVRLYNDTTSRTLAADKHPQILGMPAKDAWREVIGPQIDQVMSGGEATWQEDQFVPLIRDGQLRPACWT